MEIGSGKLSSIIKNQLSTSLVSVESLDWISENVDYLEELGILSGIKQGLVNNFKRTKWISDLISYSDKLKFPEKLQQELEEVVLNATLKANDFKLLSDQKMQTFISPKAKGQIFEAIMKKALEVGISNNEEIIQSYYLKPMFSGMV